MNGGFNEIDTIRDRLFDLSDDQFAKLVSYMERTRDMESGRSISKDALAAMRPRLRVSRPPRRLNVERIFCRPFEDLLINAERPVSRPGRIARGSIAACWSAISRRLAPVLLSRLRQDISGMAAADANWPQRFGPPLWKAVGAVFDVLLAEAGRDAKARDALVAELGGPAIEAEFTMMARLNEIAEITEELRYILSPKPLATLGVSHAAAVSAQFKALQGAKEKLWEPMAHFVIARMAEPIVLARAYGSPSCSDPGLHFLGVTASKVTIADVDATLGELAKVVAGSPDAAIEVASRGEEVADQIVKLRESVRERKFAGSVAEIEKMQRGLRMAVSRNVLDGTDTAIVVSLKGSSAGLDAVSAAERDALRQSAEARAHALWKCSRFAGKIGMDREVTATAKSIEDAAAQMVFDQMAALSRGAVHPEAIDAVQASLVHAVRVTELVAGPERANALRKRGFEAIERLQTA